MQRKLNPRLIRKIQARRKAGSSFEDLKREFKCSIGTISNALKVPAKPATAKRTAGPLPAVAPTEPSEPTAPPTHDDLRRWLAEQVTGLRADAERYRTEENAAALATTNRALVAASALLERVTPASPPRIDHNEDPDFQKLGAEGEARFLNMLAKTLEDRKDWPRCPACGQHAVPDDLEERMEKMGSR